MEFELAPLLVFEVGLSGFIYFNDIFRVIGGSELSLCRLKKEAESIYPQR